MNDADSSILINRAQDGDASAQQQLLLLHRDRLKRMIAVYLDRRLSARIDPSDVVQETLAAAAAQLPSYLIEQPVAFYPWLRKIAEQKLIHVHRHHVNAKRRSVLREQPFGSHLPDESINQILDHLVKSQTSPSGHAELRDMQQRLNEAIESLTESDRATLLMRFVERLSVQEISDVVKITVPAAQSRLRRALIRLGEQMVDPEETSE